MPFHLPNSFALFRRFFESGVIGPDRTGTGPQSVTRMALSPRGGRLLTSYAVVPARVFWVSGEFLPVWVGEAVGRPTDVDDRKWPRSRGRKTTERQTCVCMCVSLLCDEVMSLPERHARRHGRKRTKLLCELAPTTHTRAIPRVAWEGNTGN